MHWVVRLAQGDVKASMHLHQLGKQLCCRHSSHIYFLEQVVDIGSTPLPA
jgi:hypothetical protein